MAWKEHWHLFIELFIVNENYILVLPILQLQPSDALKQSLFFFF